MKSKLCDTALQAVSPIHDGATVLISGFSGAGVPEHLIDALVAHGSRNLTLVHNNAGNAMTGVAKLLAAGQVAKIICSFPRSWESHVFDSLYQAGKIELEIVPQGTLAERLRAAGSGLGGFFTPSGYGTDLAIGKETRLFHGRGQIFETALPGDFALIQARRADHWGNLQYRMAARNFGPVMCMAGRHTIVEVDDIVPSGSLDPECVVTSGAFIQTIVNSRRQTS